MDLDPDPASQNKTDPDPQPSSLAAMDKMSCLMIVLAAGVRPSFSTSLYKHMTLSKFKNGAILFSSNTNFSFSKCTMKEAF